MPDHHADAMQMELPEDVQLEIQAATHPLFEGERLRSVEGIEDVISMPDMHRIAMLAYQRGRAARLLRLEKLEEAIIEHNRACDLKCCGGSRNGSSCEDCPRQYMIEVPNG